MRVLLFILVPALLIIYTPSALHAQRNREIRLPKSDTTTAAKTDTAKTHKKKTEQGKAALRAALIPGWGQIYNKKYWKVPLVYGALAVPVTAFNYNLNWYKKTREAYQIKYYNDTSIVSDLPTDKIDQRLQPLSKESLRRYRNSFRQNMDYSILGIMAVWGLQIADATVDAHLRGFNISDDLSLKIKPTIPRGNTAGVGIFLRWRNPKTETTHPGF